MATNHPAHSTRASSHRAHGGHKSIIVALVLGIAAGVILQRFTHPAAGEAPAWTGIALDACRFIADMFLRALKMVIVPLVVASIISGIAGLKSLEGFARMGAKTWAYYAISGLLAVCVGLIMVNVIQPGIQEGQPNPVLREAMNAALHSKYGDQVADVLKSAEGGASSLLDIVRRMIPTNVIQAAAAGDLLAIIFVSILFAVAMVLVPGGPPKGLRDLFNELADVMTLITTWVMKFTPLAVFCLVIPAIAEVGLGVIQNLIPYVFTVVSALAFTLFVMLPLAVKLFARISPLGHFRHMRDSMLTSFSTASSTATIPVTLRCIEEEAGVSERVSSFVIPLGATVNMNGTALYECVVVVFAAQVLGLHMSVTQQFIVVLLALVSSIGVAGIPAASLVAIIIIMQNAGFTEDMIKASLGLVLTIDRPLDMMRTTVNVFSDTVGAVIIAKSEGERVR
jgi:Na+/H+-dicarboxylate symporter